MPYEMFSDVMHFLCINYCNYVIFPLIFKFINNYTSFILTSSFIKLIINNICLHIFYKTSAYFMFLYIFLSFENKGGLLFEIYFNKNY